MAWFSKAQDGTSPSELVETRQADKTAELVLRVAHLEGEMMGLGLKVDHLAESTTKALAKLARRSTREMQEYVTPTVEQVEDERDPRIVAMLAKRRSEA